MTPEGRVKKMVKKALEQFGEECWRFMPVQSGYGSVALDFLLSIRGRFVAIETKAPGKSLTPLQQSTKDAIEAAGGLVFVVWDETSLELALKIMLALEYSNGPTHRSGTFLKLIDPERGPTGFAIRQPGYEDVDEAGSFDAASNFVQKKNKRPRA